MSKQTWTFKDIISFFRCELRMRYHNCSAEMLDQSLLRVPQSEQEGFRVVRKALTAADMPASARKVLAGAQAPAYSFDPLIQKGIGSLNDEWTNFYFVRCKSKGDLDDDKWPNTSPLFKLYGMRRTPTKDKKLKPVMHLIAVIGSGCICYMAPDLMNLKLSDMLRDAIKHLIPDSEPSIRSLLTLFIDRGYLELALRQLVKISVSFAYPISLIRKSFTTSAAEPYPGNDRGECKVSRNY